MPKSALDKPTFKPQHNEDHTVVIRTQLENEGARVIKSLPENRLQLADFAFFLKHVLHNFARGDAAELLQRGVEHFALGLTQGRTRKQKYDNPAQKREDSVHPFGHLAGKGKKGGTC